MPAPLPPYAERLIVYSSTLKKESRGINILTIRLYLSDFYLPLNMADGPDSCKEQTESFPDVLSKEVEDVFIERADHDFHYKTLSWQVRNILLASV